MSIRHRGLLHNMTCVIVIRESRMTEREEESEMSGYTVREGKTDNRRHGAANTAGKLLFVFLLLFFSVSAAEVRVQADRTSLAPGETIRLQVNGDSGAVSCVYKVTLDGKKIFESKKPDRHFTSAYIPRKAGIYVIEVTVNGPGKTKDTGSVSFEVSGNRTNKSQSSSDVYSQKDGTWESAAYRKSDLETAGCAIFTLSHALHQMGTEGPETEPAALAVRYATCLVKGGTSNLMLINRAAKDFGFITRSELILDQTAIRDALQDGAVFSFSVVLGHIALAGGISDDGSKVLITDSAPTATLERIKKANLYRTDDDGRFVPVTDLSEMPGAVYYFETQHYGGMRYYLDLSYVARRGVRLIQPYQYFIQEAGGERVPVDLTAFGSVQCEVLKDGKTLRIPTAGLQWRTVDGTRRVATVTGKKAVQLKNGAGKKIALVQPCSVVQVLEQKDESVCVRYNGKRGYLPLESVEVTELPEGNIRTGLISVNGKTNGHAKVKMRFTPSGKIADNWPTGTPVAVLGEKDGSWYVEGRGFRFWVLKEYVTLDPQ